MLRQICFFFMLVFVGAVYADDLDTQSNLASDVITIKVPQVYQANAGDNTVAIMRFINHSDKGHVVIAAFSPVAKQIQLRTVVQVKKRNLPVQIHSFALSLNATTWLGHNQKHIALLGLTKNLTVGDTVPIAILYRDGSFETVQAKVVNA